MLDFIYLPCEFKGLFISRYSRKCKLMPADLLPRYYQIKQTIKKWIVNTEVSAGEKIPSENELATIFEVSRLTVRQALVQLVQEGFLVSKRGDGTYVTDDAKLINSYSLEFSGFMDDLFYQISRSKTKSVEINRIGVAKTIREKLELADVPDVCQGAAMSLMLGALLSTAFMGFAGLGGSGLGG